MNREIKFQFIIDGEELSKAYTIDEILSNDEIVILEDMEKCTCEFNESNNHCDGGCAKYEESEITGKRQFTGLKDKTGKEAYQDDLAVINGELCKINFDTHFICGWEFKSLKAGCYTFNSICTNFNNTGCADFEIIGNIYENPNLLKQL